MKPITGWKSMISILNIEGHSNTDLNKNVISTTTLPITEEFDGSDDAIVLAFNLDLNSSKCDLICRCEADLKAAIHESRSFSV